MGKSTISMVIFNSYVKLPEGSQFGGEALLDQPGFANQGLTLFTAPKHMENVASTQDTKHQVSSNKQKDIIKHTHWGYPLVIQQFAIENGHL